MIEHIRMKQDAIYIALYAVTVNGLGESHKQDRAGKSERDRVGYVENEKRGQCIVS